MMRARHSFRLPLAAAALALLSLGGCKTVDDATFFAFAGEVPGSRSPFVDYDIAARLAQGPPALRLISYRPAVAPDGKAVGETAQVRTAFANVRQQLSDRDDELRFRRRSLVLYGIEYVKSLKELRYNPGDPLPAYNSEFRGYIRGAHAALNNLEGDLAKMNGTLARLDGNLKTADAVAARARTLASAPPETGTDPGLRAALAKAAETTAKVGHMLATQTRNDLGAYVVYISRQREALNRLDRQVHSARGPTPMEKFRATKTLVHWLPKSWQPKGYRDQDLDKKDDTKW